MEHSSQETVPALDQERVSGLNHKIKEEKLIPGDHIYIHEWGGLTNKHGIFIGKEKVVLYCHVEKKVIEVTVEHFSGHKHIRLALYNQRMSMTLCRRKGTTFSDVSQTAEDVVEKAKFYSQNPDKWKVPYFGNKGETFAKCCKIYPVPIDTKDLRPGDHISIERKRGLYTHHGIFVSQDEGVIHFTGDKKLKCEIKAESLAVFLQDTGQLCRFSRAHVSVKLPESEKLIHIARREIDTLIKCARHFAKHPEKWPKYKLLSNNCELFCIWVTLGAKYPAHLFQHQARKCFSVLWKKA